MECSLLDESLLNQPLTNDILFVALGAIDFKIKFAHFFGWQGPTEFLQDPTEYGDSGESIFPGQKNSFVWWEVMPIIRELNQIQCRNASVSGIAGNHINLTRRQRLIG